MSAAALERQIRPIYDALDTGSNKSAIVACNKVLKKHPQNDLVKALKSLALVRSQKVEESLVLCDEVLAKKPTNDGVLAAMAHVLRALGRLNDIIVMWEEAFKQQPANEEYGAQTFMANVRGSNWKAAQQIATRLYKTFQEDRYLYWSVISAVLQANDRSTPSAMRTILYKLAHRLIDSCQTPSFLNTDRFHLHLSILYELKLFDEARKLLDEEPGKSICANNLSCDDLRRKIVKAQGLVEEEGKRSQQLISEKNDRNWLEFLAVLDGVIDPLAPTDAQKENAATNIESTKQFFSRIAELDGRSDRSGLLAILELERRTREHKLSQDPSRLVFLLKQYFGTFGDKACCFEDLKPYTDLEGDERQEWTDYLNSAPISFDSTESLQRVINVHKLLRHRLTTSEISVDTEKKRLEKYISHYEQALPLGSSLPATELQPADDLALLAGNAYISLWALTGEQSYLQAASSFLEYALQKSKQSFLTRLILVRVYRLLGAPSLALDHYRAMQIKQVQNDTLSHLLLSRSSTFSSAPIGDLTYISECLEATQIYLSNSQETSEFISRVFNAEKYSQIPEFILFEERLENSLQRDCIKIEYLRMRLSHETILADLIDMELIELKFVFDRLHHDNRDFEIFPEYQPAVSKTLNEQTLLFGKPDGVGWLSVFLKTYIRAFQHASDLDETVEDKLLIGDRPKQTGDFDKSLTLQQRLVQRDEAEIAELTADEASMIEYATALANWLEPFHDYARPPPAVVLAEAAKQNELKTGHPLKGIQLPPTNGTNGHKKEDPPTVTEPSATILKYFEDAKARFDDVKKSGSVAELLHLATLIQEAFLLFIVESSRFKAPSVIKINKFGGLIPSFKIIRTSAVAVLKDISADLLALSESQATAESRKPVVETCKSVPTTLIDQDFGFIVGKKIVDARKKALEGAGKGLAKTAQQYGSAFA